MDFYSFLFLIVLKNNKNKYNLNLYKCERVNVIECERKV